MSHVVTGKDELIKLEFVMHKLNYLIKEAKKAKKLSSIKRNCRVG